MTHGGVVASLVSDQVKLIDAMMRALLGEAWWTLKTDNLWPSGELVRVTRR